MKFKIKLFVTLGIVALLANNITVKAQTLQFSQTLLVGALDTVPASKTWKICGILPTSQLTSSAASWGGQWNSTSHIISVNGTSIYWASSSASAYEYNGSSTAIFTDQDIWLPAGTTLQAGAGVYRISVLEFTIVP